MLENVGFAVTAVASADAALRVWDTHGPFEALVSDLAMPGMSGRELVAHLAQRGASPPVVFISGYSNQAIEPVERHRTEFVQKPFTGAELTTAVQDAIHRLVPSA